MRRDSTALRNLRDYHGVSASRLEVLEERLKSDVVSELDEFQGRILLHSETADGEVVPVWESVDKPDVASVREVMDEAASKSKDVALDFVRIPITSEQSPDVSCRGDPLTRRRIADNHSIAVLRLDRALGTLRPNRLE